MVVEFNIPLDGRLRVISEANRSWNEPRWATGKRAAGQRKAARDTTWHAVRDAWMRGPRPSRITLCRVSARRGNGRWKLDKDNLAASLKHVQDGIADALGIDDGKLVWSYDQRKGAAWGVDVELVYEGDAKKGDDDANE